MAGYTLNSPGIPTIIGITTAVNFAAGVPGTVGKANDTILNGLKIAQNGTAITVTITGFRDHTSSPASFIFTGSTTQDSWWPLGWLNTAGSLTITASVAGKVIVETLAAVLGP